MTQVSAPGDAAAVARQWFELHNDGTPDSYGSTRFLSLYADDVELKFLSGIPALRGEAQGIDWLRASHDRSSAHLRNRHAALYELIADGDRAAMRYRWQATVAVAYPDLPVGTLLRYDIAHFITVRDGKIVRSHEYAVRIE